jgi:23S rRNA pseudouridine2605 synthase
MSRRIHHHRHSASSLGQTARRYRTDARQPAQFRSHDSATEHGERLQKVLASAGVASRRECEELIREGRVEIDHHVVTQLGTRVDPQRQEIRVDGEVLSRPKLVYFAVNKPIGVVSTSRDPAGRPRVIDLLPPNTPRVFCVGRLDITSEGLILVTNDGELANGLTHPRHGVEKIYQVHVAGQVEPEVLAQLHRGMHLAEGFAHAKHVRIKSRRKRSTLLEMVLDEGRNREVRRLLARVGHKVQRLKRIAVGPVRLGDLPPGAVRPLSPKEVQLVKRSVVSGERKQHGHAANAAHKPNQPSRNRNKDQRVQQGKRFIIH